VEQSADDQVVRRQMTARRVLAALHCAAQ
jgi:hypothetical protein